MIKIIFDRIIHLKNISNTIRSIPLSNNTVKLRIDEIAECVESINLNGWAINTYFRLRLMSLHF